MKRKITILLTSLVLAVGVTACGRNTAISDWGKSKTITLNPGEKLENISWQSSKESLWIQTRPMREDESAETHYFRQSTNYG